MKHVVFNADDFGSSDAVNAAIVKAHREGLLTSASLMVNEVGLDGARAAARECPDLGVGLHLVLSNGRSALPPSEIPALVNDAGRFPDDPAVAGFRAFFRSAARRQVEMEVAAQFEGYDRTDLACDHADGHQHLHMHPVIWDALVSQCRARSVRWVRIPYEEFIPWSRQRVAARRVEWSFFRMLRKRCLRSLRNSGLRAVDRVYGHLESGKMTEEYLLELLPRLKGETNEIYSHPGAVAANGDEELNCLLSDRVRERVQTLGIEPMGFSKLDPNASPERRSAASGGGVE
jgi:hopanoid biosynthesis associated protein HpnK